MKATFLLSTLTEFPKLKSPQGILLPEIALVGKSNVGKSSLINHLLNQKIAKTSATPGKTQLLNFFLIDEKFILVDLPGYGFAKAPPAEVKKWSDAINHYIDTRETLKLIFLLVDCRRKYSEEDIKLINWANSKNISLVIIFTKTDKLSKQELQKLKTEHPEAVLYSVMNNFSKHLLEKRIETIL